MAVLHRISGRRLLWYSSGGLDRKTAVIGHIIERAVVAKNKNKIPPCVRVIIYFTWP